MAFRVWVYEVAMRMLNVVQQARVLSQKGKPGMDEAVVGLVWVQKHRRCWVIFLAWDLFSAGFDLGLLL